MFCLYWSKIFKNKNVRFSRSKFLISLFKNELYLHFAGIPHFTGFRDTGFFYKLKVCGNPASGKSIGAIFPTAFVHFVSLYHIFIILRIFKHFLCCCICYGDLWSVIFDVTIVIVLGHHKSFPYKTANLTHKCCVGSDCFTNRPFPCLPPSPQASLFPGTQQFWN